MSSGFDFGPDVFEGYPDDYLATYLFRLPFGLGLDPDENHIIQTTDVEAATRGRPEAECVTWVNFRLARLATGGDRYFPQSINSAAQYFYEQDIPIEDPDARFAPDKAYELWVSAETPLARFPGEPHIHARTLERCFRSLDTLLRAYRLATRDPSIYPLGPASINKMVPVGVRDVDGGWHYVMTLIMRPESGIPAYPTSMTPQQMAAFVGAVQGLALGHPFLRGKDLELTAYRQAFALDDLTAAIVSLQTAMESTLFELWHLTMVDSRMTRSEIETETQSDKPFKTLLTRLIPSLLGGRWNLKSEETPVGRYWRSLYQLRNSVVHSGDIPQEWQFSEARSAYNELIVYLAERLLINWHKYPRTLAAFGHARGLPPGMSLPKEAEGVIASIMSEPKPFWWPRDSA
jgi:hypothetical protein